MLDQFALREYAQKVRELQGLNEAAKAANDVLARELRASTKRELSLRAEVERLRAERDKMRWALDKAKDVIREEVDHGECYCCDLGYGARMACGHCCSVAVLPIINAALAAPSAETEKGEWK